MRRIALLAMPLLIVGLAPLSADTAAQPEGHDLTIPTITPVDSSDDMMMSKDMMMMDVEHTHDMGTADDAEDDVTHSHSFSHTHDMGTEDPADDVTHDHGEYSHTHDEEGMMSAASHGHDFHSHDDGASTHYHIGGFGDHEHAVVHAGPQVTLEGSSTLRWGIDLSTNATGFRNEHSVKLKVVVVPKATKSHSGDTGGDDLYATIELKDFKWEIDSADGSGKTTAPGITTGLHMGPFSLKTYSAPSIDIDYVDGKDNDEWKTPFHLTDPTKDTDPDPGYPDFLDDVSTTYKGSGGLELGYEIDPVTLTLGVLSANDWAEEGAKEHKLDAKIDLKNCTPRAVPKDDGTADTFLQCDVVKVKKPDNNDQNDENAYAFLGKAKVKIGESANVEFAVAYAHNYQEIGAAELNDDDFLNQDKVDDTGQDVDDIGLGALASFDLLDSDGDGDNDLTTKIAFDGRIPSDDSNIPWDVGGGLEWGLSADDESKLGADLMMHIPADGGESEVSVIVSLKEGDGDKGALAGLGAELAVRLDGLTSDQSVWTTRIKGSYDVEGIKPFFAVHFSSEEDAETAFRAGLELAVIDHLTTTLMYRNADITGGADKGDLTAALTVKY